MSAIGKIRERSTLLVAIVFIALAAFVLGDLFRGCGTGAGEGTSIGEVYGEPIPDEMIAQYNQRVETATQDAVNRGQELNAGVLRQIRETEWNRLIRGMILGREVEFLGLTVTNEELTAIVHGSDTSVIHRFIKGDPTFRDSTTGKFSSRLVTAFLQQVEQAQPEFKERWQNFLNFIKEDRLYTKYYKLIEKGIYATNMEVQQNFEANTATRKIRFVVRKYADISDSAVTVSDDDLYTFYEEHKHEKQYEQRGSKVVEYVQIDMAYSEDDLEKTRSLLEGKKNRFARSTNDSLFVVTNSANPVYNPNLYVRKGDLSPEDEKLAFTGEKGVVVGPYREGNMFKIAKIVGLDTIPERRARHILIPYLGSMRAQPDVTRTKERAQKMADSVAAIIKADTSKFAVLASSMSSDLGSAAQKGDLGWFGEGMMVTPFNDFCFDSPVGAIGVVATDFGYHVIEVTGQRDLAAKAVIVEAEIKPLDGTIKQYREKAIEFIAEARAQKADFKELSGKFQYPVQEIEVGDEDYMVPGFENSYEVLGWLKNAPKGDISNPMVSGNAIVVARLKKIKSKGVPDLEDVKEMMMIPARKDKKAEMVWSEMSGNSLDEVSNRVKQPVLDATLRFSDFTIPGGGGNEPEVVGAVFANYQDGDIIGPVKGRVGVYTILLQQSTPAGDPGDLSATRNSLTMGMRAGVENAIYAALEKLANVIDNRNE
jgi:parvulin-like peptidyl-prolyl isomerase